MSSKLITAATALLTALMLSSIGHANQLDRTVSITRQAFSPSAIAVNYGEKVTFVNSDSRRHSVIWDEPGFTNSPPLDPGQSYSVNMNVRAKVYEFHDGYYPSHTGKIRVYQQPGPPPAIPSFTVAPLTVTFNDPKVPTVRLSGQISPLAGGEPVQLMTGPAQGGPQTLLATVRTSSDGRFVFDAPRPNRLTYYFAYWKTASSTAVVQVRPLITVSVWNGLRLRVWTGILLYNLPVEVWRRFGPGDWRPVMRIAYNTGRWTTIPFSRLKSEGHLKRGTHVLYVKLPADPANRPMFIVATSRWVKVKVP